MKYKFFTTLVFLTASVFFLSENVHAGRLNQFKKKYETKIDGFGIDNSEFGKTYCVDFARDLRVCKAYDSEGGFCFLVQKNQKTIKNWNHPPGVGNETDNFYVYYGQLDKNSSPELVVVSHINTTNGMGIPTSNVYILSEPLKNNSENPLVFQIQEFGEHDNFVYDAKQRETLILATEWRNYSNLDKNRGAGIYLVGRWFRYRRGLLEFAFDKPILARRYLFSFEKERSKTLEDNEWHHRPYLWLKNPNTHKFYKEPPENSELLSVKFGTVEKYAESSIFENYRLERKLTVRFDSNETLTYSNKSEDSENEIPMTDVGVLPQRIGLPFRASFSAMFSKIEGKKVRIETYQGKYNYKYTKLWFIE